MESSTLSESSGAPINKKKKYEITLLSSLRSPFLESRNGSMRMRNLLHIKGIEFLEIDASTTDPNLREKLKKISGIEHYPQVFVTVEGNIHFIGDEEMIFLLEEDNKLDAALGILKSIKILPKRKEESNVEKAVEEEKK